MLKERSDREEDQASTSAIKGESTSEVRESARRMDLSRRELSRIVSATNPHAATIEEEEGEPHRYYFVDTAGCNETGETALHRILALHAPSESIRNFLHIAADQHRISQDDLQDKCLSTPPPKDYILQQNKNGATALHVAVHRNSWHVYEIVKCLLEENPKLADIPMSCGSYPLHVLTGQSLTIHSGAFVALLNASPEISSRQDFHGDTPLSLLYKNVLRFRWARSWERGHVPADVIKRSSDLSFMTIIAPSQFLDYSLQLIAAATANGQKLSWHAVCATPRCPPLLVRMLLHHHHNGDDLLTTKRKPFKDRDAEGRLPLHCAAAAQAVSSRFVPTEVATDMLTVLEIVLAAYPAAASVADSTGRLPLHYAVDNATLMNNETTEARSPQKAVLSLARTFPTALSIQDPVTGLYPVQKLAATLPTDSDSSSSCALDVLYRLLHTNPDVCNYYT